MYIINTIPHGKCFVRYLRTRCFCIRNLTRSLCSLVRFLIRQQLGRKNRTPALFMKYSLCIHFVYSFLAYVAFSSCPRREDQFVVAVFFFFHLRSTRTCHCHSKRSFFGSSVFLVVKNPYDLTSQIRFCILQKKRTLRLLTGGTFVRHPICFRERGSVQSSLLPTPYWKTRRPADK